MPISHSGLLFGPPCVLLYRSSIKETVAFTSSLFVRYLRCSKNDTLSWDATV